MSNCDWSPPPEVELERYAVEAHIEELLEIAKRNRHPLLHNLPPVDEEEE